MQHLNKDTFPWACSVKFAKVTYKTIDKRNIYIMIIYLSQPFSIYNWAWKPKTKDHWHLLWVNAYGFQ